MGDFDAIVAGAGIWGCTVARRLAEAGRKVLVLEKRAAVGGNSMDVGILLNGVCDVNGIPLLDVCEIEDAANGSRPS